MAAILVTVEYMALELNMAVSPMFRDLTKSVMLRIAMIGYADRYIGRNRARNILPASSAITAKPARSP